MAKEVVEGEGRINFNLLVCVHKNTWICYYQKKTDSRNEGVKVSQGLASPQTSFGVRLSRIHECVTNEPQRTSAGRLVRAVL